MSYMQMGADGTMQMALAPTVPMSEQSINQILMGRLRSPKARRTQAKTSEEGAQKIIGRYATVTALKNTETALYVEGTACNEVQTGPESEPVEWNSVILIPGLLSIKECDEMVAEVEATHEAMRTCALPITSEYPFGWSDL